MTIHFVNILTWKYFTNAAKDDKTIYIDGFLLKLLLLVVVGKNYVKQSGLNYFHDKLNTKKCLYLTRDGMQGYEYELQLPNWESMEDIVIPYNVLSFLENNTLDSVVIGISSPKQDKLAELILNDYPYLNIYCLGAAIYTKQIFKSEYLLGTLFTMFVNDPQRTFLKLFRSIRVFAFNILCDKAELKQFCLQIPPNSRQVSE